MTIQKKTLALAAGVHIVLILLLGLLAGKEGLLGKKIQALTVQLVPKEKVVEPPKAKQEAPRPVVELPKPIQETVEMRPIRPVEAPVVMTAPPPVVEPTVIFNDGAKNVITTEDPIQLYKSKIERIFWNKWKFPTDSPEESSTTISVSINDAGTITGIGWTSQKIGNLNNDKFQNSVRDVVAQVQHLGIPPKTFPRDFQIRFDVVEEP